MIIVFEWKNYLRVVILNNKNLENCPEKIDLGNNQLTEFSWQTEGSLVPQSLKTIYLSNNQLTEFSWEHCPNSVEIIDLKFNNIKKIDLTHCRNENIKIIYPEEYYENYLNHKNSKDFIPYLPEICPIMKFLHYELESIWWKAPDGIRFKEDIKQLLLEGYFSSTENNLRLKNNFKNNI